MMDRNAFWANLVIAHVWFAAMWIRPGWFPMAAAVASLVLAYAIRHEGKLRESLGNPEDANA